MAVGTTLFQLRSESGQAFDGSTRGISVVGARNATALPGDGGFRLERGVLELARNAALDGLQTFSIEATITPEQISGDRRNIAESQSPGIALFIEPNGKLVGSVLTAAGWVTVDSGATLIAPGKTAQVRFVRHENGQTELQIGRQTVGSKSIPGPIQNAGPSGFKIGAWVDGQRFPFIGQVGSLQIREGAVTQQFQATLAAKAQQIATKFRQKTGLTRVAVSLVPDEGHARLQPIRDIMNAAGVTTLSDLATLQIAQPTAMTPGKMLVAPKKAPTPGKIDWSVVAETLSTATASAKRQTLATMLSNRNSAKVLGTIQTAAGTATAAGAAAGTGASAPSGTLLGGTLAAGSVIAAGLVSPLSGSLIAEARFSVELAQQSATLRRQLEVAALPELFLRNGGQPKLADGTLLKALEGGNPALWPSSASPVVHTLTPNTIPVGSAVIIASTLDLTNTQLVIEPAVTKLYIIAEEVICGPGAQITWRRPGGTTPARLDDPALDGRGWDGVHTFPNSRDGLHGENGRPGQRGLDGARGVNSPELEMWVKRLTAIPNLDLNGEDGRPGGRGQRGGRGGDGADGRLGERAWFFGWHCTARPGHGGHGGNGGAGGSGGRGGDGGSGGDITIGVLEGTLAATVTNKSFKIKDQGGQRGPGGAGGFGGGGGFGGRAGIGETCKDAQHGRDGAQGQPGPAGSQGFNLGIDGEIQLFEFSEDAWDELLTRPWISELVPTEAFPGDQLTIRGSRFTPADRVLVGTATLSPTINADESVSVTIPMTIGGGNKPVVVRRPDGTESNRLNVGIKPQLAALPALLSPSAEVNVSGNGFLSGASVLIDGAGTPATVNNDASLRFTMPGTSGTGSAGGSVVVQVRNPDGRVSNPRTASRPRILEVPFRYGVHNLTFGNFTDGVPSWDTYEDTFGAAEVWHELLDPVFGHPVLTGAFYFFYEYFLKGTANGGLATGFCTSLASLVADKFWKGETDATTQTKAALHEFLTAVHGKLLSRESLIHFHDQGREGLSRVERTAREIEATFLRGCDRQNAPLLFFIPSGAAWDDGYFDKLGDAHCVMPYRFVYPPSHPGPALSPDGSTTISELDGVQMFVWDCNRPENANCRVAFRRDGGVLHFDYFNGGNSVQFSSADDITLGMMTNGAYLLSDHDLPFSGPLGLTRFIIDFLLSPADLQITDGFGLRAGNFGGQILSEIPDSHPCYLVPGMYMLPANTSLTRRIVGSGTGAYAFHSIMPGGGSVALEGVQTSAGQEDVLAMNGDGTQIRFSPGSAKTFNMTIARQVGGQARAVAIRGAAGAPGQAVDITLSPELSLVRVGNRGAARTVEVRAFSVDQATNAPVTRKFEGVSLPSMHDLLVAVPDWKTLEVNVEALSFE
jgi:hypothetical protein